MKNKLLVMICICFLAVFMLGACGGSSQDSASTDTSEAAQTETKMMGESVDLISSDEGSLKFVGFFQADPDFTDQEGDYIFVFDFTNLKDDPELCANTFVIQFFQNGSELTLNSYTMKFEPEDQYDLIQSEINTALKGGTVHFGHLVVPKDDSPITIMASENRDRDHYETIEVNLKDGTVTASENNGSGDSVETADIESMLQGDWSYGANTFSFNDGSLSILENGNEVLSGDYTIDTDNSSIVGTLHASDGDVKITLPYTLDGGVLHVQNNKGEELTH